ncbi:MAG: signal recognition particle-docking protein FtsY [Bdellovibrionota bacterium]|nr:MAG: signal recognition particle-docking protein FtsY [Bdellovibrionota bacterium]
MDFESFITRVAEIAQNVSTQYGTGQVIVDFLLLLFALCLFVLVIGLFSLRRSSDRASNDRSQRYDGLGGRVEKLEMSINGLRTETMRTLEQFRQELASLRTHLFSMRDQLSPGWEEKRGSGFGSEALASLDEPGPESREPLPPISEVLPQPIVAKSAEAEEARPTSLTMRLVKARTGFFDRLKALFSKGEKIDKATLDELEALLVEADVGIVAAQELIHQLKTEIGDAGSLSQEEVIAFLKVKILRILEEGAPLDAAIQPARRSDGPCVVLMVGVNGVGKTTTSAKLASMWKAQGLKVAMVAADTFRAAAVSQLKGWGERLDIPVIAGVPDAKPQTVVFDAMEQSKKERFDVMLIDTAGRLHTKSNLMQELEGVRSTIERHQAGAPHEVILVVDGSTGQNALQQAKEFHAALKLSGVIVTKLDGTPKGGIVIAIKKELGVPVRYIGVGEAAKDLRTFQPQEFVEALFNREGLSSNSTEALSAHAEERVRRRRRE